MNWNDAAEDLLNNILSQTLRPLRDSTEQQIRDAAESAAADEGKNRVGVETVIAAWVKTAPESTRADIPRLMEKFGLEPDDYRFLLE